MPQVAWERRLSIVDTFQPILSWLVEYYSFDFCDTDDLEMFRSSSEATCCDGRGSSFTWKLNVLRWVRLRRWCLLQVKVARAIWIVHQDTIVIFPLVTAMQVSHQSSKCSGTRIINRCIYANVTSYSIKKLIDRLFCGSWSPISPVEFTSFRFSFLYSRFGLPTIIRLHW